MGDTPISNITKHLQDYFNEIKEFSDNVAKINEFLKIFEIKIQNTHSIENLVQLELFNEKLDECIVYLRDNEYGIGKIAKQNLSRTAEQSYRLKFQDIQLVYNIYNSYYKSFKRDIINSLVAKNRNKIDIRAMLGDITNTKLIDYYLRLVTEQTGKRAEFIFNMMRLEIELAMGQYNYDQKQFIYVPNYNGVAKEFTKKLSVSGNNIILNRRMVKNALYVTPKSDLKDYYSKTICETDEVFKTRDWYPHKFSNDTDDFSATFDEKVLAKVVGAVMDGNFDDVGVLNVYECFAKSTYREMYLSSFEKYKLCKLLLRKHEPVEGSFDMDFNVLDLKTMTMYKNKVVDVKIDSTDFVKEMQKCKGKCELKDIYYIVKNIIYKHYKFNEDNINYSIKTVVNNICILSAKYILSHLGHAGKQGAEGYHELFQNSFLNDDNSRLTVLENLI